MPENEGWVCVWREVGRGGRNPWTSQFRFLTIYREWVYEILQDLEGQSWQILGESPGFYGTVWGFLKFDVVLCDSSWVFWGGGRGFFQGILPRDSSKGFFHGILSEDSHQLDDAHGNDSAVHGVPALRDRAVNVDVDALIHRSFINKTKPNKND